MAEYKRQRGLGRGFNPRGLNALIDTETEENNSEKNGPEYVEIMKIEPNRSQPRKKFVKEGIEELCESIKEIGIIQPLIVKKNGDFYEIVAGERRYRAARLAGLEKVPVIVRNLDELEALQMSLIENIQREDLSPIEEALTYKRFNEEFSLTQEEIAKKVGKNRSTVANAMRLLNLDERVIDLINDKKISAGHGKTLAGINDKEKQFEYAKKIADSNMSVRQAESLVSRDSRKETNKTVEENSVVYNYARTQLSQLLGTKVNIRAMGNKCRLEIDFYSDEWLDSFLSLIKGSIS